MKLFMTGSLTFIVTTLLLYGIGFFFHVKFLTFHFYEAGKTKDVIFTAGGSLVPLVIGIVATVIVQYILNSRITYKHR